jgi:hypothetical protein
MKRLKIGKSTPPTIITPSVATLSVPPHQAIEPIDVKTKPKLILELEAALANMSAKDPTILLAPTPVTPVMSESASVAANRVLEPSDVVPASPIQSQHHTPVASISQTPELVPVVNCVKEETENQDMMDMLYDYEDKITKTTDDTNYKYIIECKRIDGNMLKAQEAAIFVITTEITRDIIGITQPVILSDKFFCHTPIVKYISGNKFAIKIGNVTKRDVTFSIMYTAFFSS